MIDTKGLHEYKLEDKPERVGKKQRKVISDVDERFKDHSVCKECK